MHFDQKSDGRVSQRFFGAHTYRRTAFAGDYTGLELQWALIDRVTQLNVAILDRVYITRILVDDLLGDSSTLSTAGHRHRRGR